MAEPRRGREHGAEGAHEAILNAAEEVFAQHGFDGARIDAIAAASGYNKSLIFHYFDDKLGLYTALIARLNEESSQITNEILLYYEETATYDATWFRSFIETVVGMTFDYFLAHPKTLRIMAWEAAEDWQTIIQVMTKLDLSRLERIRQFLAWIQAANLMRPGLDVNMLFSIIISICQSYLTSIPRYQAVFKEEDLASPAALVRAREQIVAFVVHGTLVEPGTTAS